MLLLESSTWNPESRTVLDSLTWGDLVLIACRQVLHQRSNDATAMRTSLKKVNLCSFSLNSDYSYALTLSNVGEPS